MLNKINKKKDKKKEESKKINNISKFLSLPSTKNLKITKQFSNSELELNKQVKYFGTNGYSNSMNGSRNKNKSKNQKSVYYKSFTKPQEYSNGSILKLGSHDIKCKRHNSVITSIIYKKVKNNKNKRQFKVECLKNPKITKTCKTSQRPLQNIDSKNINNSIGSLSRQFFMCDNGSALKQFKYYFNKNQTQMGIIYNCCEMPIKKYDSINTKETSNSKFSTDALLNQKLIGKNNSAIRGLQFINNTPTTISYRIMTGELD